MVVEVLPDAGAVARRGAEVVAGQAAQAIAARGAFTLALSGGRTPWAMLAELAEALPWDQVTIFQVDERIAPDGDPDRNLTHFRRSLPPMAVGRVQAMPVDGADLEAGAAAYAALLPHVLDVVHLGLGPDGHTASLVPDDPVLDVTGRDVALTAPYRGRRRMTLTYPVLDRARHLLWLVTGEDKVDALRRLLAGDPSIPAGRVRSDDGLVLADAAAAGA